MKTVFISSTFKDMQDERDVINGKIFPKIRHNAEQNGQSINFSDLRWGIETAGMTEEEANAKIFSICFDEIERCKPYFIVLLGDRYGFVPNDISEDEATERDSAKSITHMEIQKGIFENPEKKNIFIYFREADYSGAPDEIKNIFVDADINKKRLDNLKAQLKQEFGDRIKTYRTKWDSDKSEFDLGDFSEIVYTDLWDRFSEEFLANEAKSPLEALVKENELFRTKNSDVSFVDAKKLSLEVKKILSAKSSRCYTGDEYSDKTIYLLNILNGLEQQKSNVFGLFCGLNKSSVRNAAEMLLYGLTKSIGQDYPFLENASLTYEQILKLIMDKRDEIKEKIFFFLDSIELCENFKQILRFISWIKHFFAGKVIILFTCNDDKKAIELLSSFEPKQIRYSKQEIREILEQSLLKHRKNIHDLVKKQIINTCKTPFGIRLAVTRLLQLDKNDFEKMQRIAKEKNFDDAYARMIYLCALAKYSFPKDTTRFALDLINRLVCRIDGADGKNKQIAATLAFVAFSENGLTQKQIEGLLACINEPWSQLRFSELLIYADDFLVFRENGLLDFKHKAIRAAIKQSNDSKFFCRAMAAFFNADSKESDSARNEAMWYAYCGDWVEALVPMALNLSELRSKDEMGERLNSRNALKDIFLADGSEFLIKGLLICDEGEEQESYIRTMMFLIMEGEYDDRNQYVQAANFILALLSYEKISKSFKATAVNIHLMNFYSKGLSNVKFEAFEDLIKEADEEREKMAASAVADTNNVSETFSEKKSEGRMHLIVQRMIDAGMYDAAEKELLMTLQGALSSESADDRTALFRSNIYTKLGKVYKEKKEWEKALDVDFKCYEYYNNELKHLKDGILAEKYYLQAIRNIANIYEAWAIATSEQHLWQKAKEWYEKSFDYASIVLGSTTDNRTYRMSMALFFSFGNTQIMTGNIEAGYRLFRSAQEMSSDYIGVNKESVDIDETLCSTILHTLDSVILMYRNSKYKNAVTLLKSVPDSILMFLKNAISHNELKRLAEYMKRFFEESNGALNHLQENKEIKTENELIDILADIAWYVVPPLLNDDRGWKNFLWYHHGVAEMCYANKKYKIAGQKYWNLANGIEHYKLLKQFDINTKEAVFVLEAFLGAFGGQINCLTKTNRTESAFERIKELPEYADILFEGLPELKEVRAQVMISVIKYLDNPDESVQKAIIELALESETK